MRPPGHTRLLPVRLSSALARANRLQAAAACPPTAASAPLPAGVAPVASGVSRAHTFLGVDSQAAGVRPVAAFATPGGHCLRRAHAVLLSGCVLRLVAPPSGAAQ